MDCKIQHRVTLMNRPLVPWTLRTFVHDPSMTNLTSRRQVEDAWRDYGSYFTPNRPLCTRESVSWPQQRRQYLFTSPTHRRTL
jgi:NAD/NADP transhydrogenase alpha subunit